MHLLKSIIRGLELIFFTIWQLIINFWDYLGLGDFLQNTFIFLAILFVLSNAGLFVSTKHKKTIRAIIFSFSDVVLIIRSFFSYIKSR